MPSQSRPKMVLPPEAYQELPAGEPYKPVIPADADAPELTLQAVLVGVAVGILFGAANAYLGLKVGLTVSASIPAAVIGVAVFRALGRGHLLETNIVQTIGSTGESLAAGAIFTLPVLYLWGETPGFWPIFPLSLLGGLLGVLFMIPLRRFLIVQEHGRLTYPEGTACAEILVASQAGSSQAKLLFAGLGIGSLYSALERFGRLWPTEPNINVAQAGFRTSFGATVTPELLGVGYIIGPAIATVIFAGGAIGWLVIMPLIYFFGSGVPTPIPPETVTAIADMDSFSIWSRYIRYIGAGAVAFAGLFSLIKSAPTLWESIELTITALRQQGAKQAQRTDRDLPLSLVALGLLVIGLLVAFLPLRTGNAGPVGIAAGFAVVVFSFFFVTVSSRIVGIIGNSSNPISGMTIVTVLLCALLFGQAYNLEEAKVAVLTIGALVCLAAANAGDTSQDLKTGFLIGASPRNQQIAEMIGVTTTALVMSLILGLFRSEIVAGALKAPQANLIRLVIDGVLDGNLPWGLVIIGAALAAGIEMMGLPTLAFAVGLYLPIHFSVPILIGGLIRLMVERWSPRRRLNQQREAGVLYASGLIAGAALIGVVGAAIVFANPEFAAAEPVDPTNWGSAAIAFALLSASLVWVTLRSPRRSRRRRNSPPS